MVVKVSHRGLRNWIIQRLTAVLIGLYFIFIAAYLISSQPLHFAQWRHLFDSIFVKVITLIVLLATVWHAWLGLWTVLTDYVKNLTVRIILQTLVILLLLGYILWGIVVLI
ncbi:MAG: succinate dehydrogenase, hydrophobic membrane anchor protein [Proteobacteria bacterium]|nr:succinate dehydrogenase, hydrophobic membrane anchor protein [Pseudomonadota bacterium]